METPVSALHKARGLLARITSTQSRLEWGGLIRRYALPCIEAIDEALYDSKESSKPMTNDAYNELKGWLQMLQAEMYGRPKSEQIVYKRLIHRLERRLQQMDKAR